MLQGLNRNKKRRRAMLAISAGAVLMQGCAAVDRFGDRAITYNAQMQKNRRTTIVENVLRAGFGEPLQFSEVTTVTGQGAAQASIGSSLPLLGNRSTGPRLFNFSPTLQASGGPAFAVANQNNQEFFNGLNTPLTNEAIASYAASADTRLALFLLTIASIDYDLQGRHYHFEADPDRVAEFKAFQSTVIALIKLRLTFERKDATTYVGPPLSGEEVRNSVLDAILKSTSDKVPTLRRFVIAEPGDKAAVDALSPADRTRLGASPDFYRLTTSSPKVTFCFAPAPNKENFGRQSSASATVEPLETVIGKYFGADVLFSVGADLQCGNGATDPRGIKKLTIRLRSVRSIFTMLGAMSRIQLSGIVTVPDTPPVATFDFPYGSSTEVYRLFGVAAEPDGFATAPDGRKVALTTEPRDLSGTTIQLLAELIALNSSAKNLPTPNVIPFFSP